MDIPNKLLITGASSGVGRSLADLFSKDFHLIVVARRIKRLKSYFGNLKNVSIYKADLGDTTDLELFSDRLISDHPYIPWVINNAGISSKGTVYNLSMNTIRHSVQVNALTPILLMKKLLPAMRDHNFGRVINITSGAPLNCFPGFGAYSGSKALLNALTVSAAREEKTYNIKINLMSPGPVRSEMSPQSDMDPKVCHPTARYLIDLDKNGPTGKFFWLGHEVPLFPDLEGVKWIEGDAGGKLNKVF